MAKQNKQGSKKKMISLCLEIFGNFKGEYIILNVLKGLHIFMYQF